MLDDPMILPRCERKPFSAIMRQIVRIDLPFL